MNRLKLLIVALLIIFGTLGLNAVPSFGERPFIDIYQVPDSAMEMGHIRIKLSEELSSRVQAYSYPDGSLESFGIPELDELNQDLGITKITPVFGDVSKNKKWGWRHVEWGLHLWFELEYDSSNDIRDIVMAYRDLESSVQWSEPEYKKQMLSLNQDEVTALENMLTRWTPNDTRYGEQWHYNNTGQTSGTVDADIDLPEAWDIEKGHQDVIVDVQDGGIQQDHPDLVGNLWINSDEIAGNGIDDDGNGYIDDRTGYNFVAGNATIVGHFHGTHVAGTIAARTNNATGVAGVAGGNGTTRGVSLMSTQVFTDDNSGGFENAPVYGADNGAAISQNSWGYTNVGAYDQVVLDAIDYFNANGGGVVMDGGITIYAAGNSESSGQWWPGCYSGTFSVAATTHEDTKAWYSNYDTWVDVSAPGGETSVAAEGVLSTYTGSSYNFLQGTSMACPHTSGVAALVLSYTHRNGRTLTSTELANIIENTTDNHYAVNSGYIGQLGSGRINAYQALLAADPTLPSLTITAPADGAVFDLNSTINITATATDSDGTITNVQFYIDDVLKYTDSSSPYAWAWNSTGYSGGSHAIKLIATDNTAHTVTRTINVTLLAPAEEGFETGNFSAFAWNNSSSIPWTVQSTDKFSGTYAAKSGAITHSGTTTLSLPMTVSTSGNISFYYKVSSESGYDFLRFYIDGVQQAEWSGTAGWAAASYPVTSGTRTFSWTYSKDYSVANGSDCAWLDHIIFPPHGTFYAPPQNLSATAGNGYVNLAWQAPASGSPTSYRIYRNSSLLTTVTGLSYTDNSVVNDNTYEYYITAVYSGGVSEASNTVSAYPTANPPISITIGNGTGTQTYPMDRYYNYSGHEAIYLASQIGTAMNISSLGYYKASGTDTNPIEAVTIYMKHTTDNTLATGTYSTTGYTQVYSGAFPNTTTSGWMEVALSTPFTYDGSSNLAILVIKGYQAYINSGYPYWTYSPAVGTQARQNRNDNAQPTSLTASTNLPNLKLTGSVPAILYPARNFSALGGDGFVMLNWDAPISGAPTGYKIYRNSSLLTTVTALTYTDSAVTNGTSYSYYVVASYPEGDAEPTPTVSATPNVVSSAIIGNGTTATGTQEGSPINVYFESLHGQAVYTAAELNALGVFGPINITELGFNITGLPTLAMPNYLIRMGHTTATNASAWIPSTSLSTYWSSTSYLPTATGWNMFTLDTPFTWNGTDNLVIDTAFGDIGDWNASGTVYYTSTTDGYRYTRNDNADQTNVFTGGSVTVYRPNLQISVQPYEEPAPQIEVIPTSLAYGTIRLGESSTEQFIIENTGTAILNGNITTPTGYTVAAAAARQTNTLQAKNTKGLSTSSAERNTLAYSINAGSYQSFDLTFTPTAVQAYDGNVTITHNADGEAKTIALTGQGGKSTVGLSATSFTATLAPGASSSQTLIVSNTGNMELSYSLTESGTVPWLTLNGGSSVSNTIAAGGPAQNVSIGFNATGLARGTYNATINGTSNDSASSTFSISVILNVVAPAIVVSETQIAFGTVRLNTTATEDFTISNTGNALLSGSISTPGGYSVALSRAAFRSQSELNTPALSQESSRNTLAYSVPQGESITLTVTFAPVMISNYTGNISITHNAGGANKTIALSGMGGIPDFRFYPASVSDTLFIGDSSSHTIFLNNFGNLTAEYTMSVEGNGWLSLDGVSSINGSIESYGPEVEVELVLDAGSLPAGTHNAAITGTSNGLNNANFSIPITLLVIDPNHAPEIDLPESFEIAKNDELTVDFSGFVSDVDADELWLTYEESDHVIVGLNGLLVTFIPSEGWTGSEELSFTVHDGSAQATDVVTVNVSNTAPVIDIPEGFSFDRNGSLSVDFEPYVSDANGDMLSLSYSGNVGINISIDGSWVTFTNDPAFAGAEDITFTISDGTDSSDDVVTVTVTNNPPLLFLPATATMDQDGSLTVDYSVFVTDPDLDLLELSSAGGSNVDVSIDGFNVTYTPAMGWYGTENITFTLSDGYLESTDVVQVNVNQVISSLDTPVLTIIRNAGAQQLQWDAIANATEYWIFRASEPDGDYSHIGTTSNLQFIDNAVLPRAFYQVKAVYVPMGK